MFKCFFGLTISENWIHCTKKSRIDRMIRVRRALSSKIRTVMQKTIYPTFGDFIVYIHLFILEAIACFFPYKWVVLFPRQKA